jgi:hypothetical protein
MYSLDIELPDGYPLHVKILDLEGRRKMLRQDAGGELAHRKTREVELAQAAERARRERQTAAGRPHRRPGRVRAVTVSALRALIVRSDPAHEPQLGRDAGG